MQGLVGAGQQAACRAGTPPSSRQQAQPRLTSNAADIHSQQAHTKEDTDKPFKDQQPTRMAAAVLGTTGRGTKVPGAATGCRRARPGQPNRWAADCSCQ
jgi:hypothetical protein